VREMKARGAKMGAFDVLFDDRSANPRDDEDFGRAIREHGHVVLATSVQKSRGESQPNVLRLRRPVDAIGSNALWGIVELPSIEIGGSSTRRQPNYVDRTNLAWQAAIAFGKAPADRLAARWLNYYGPEGTLPTVSYYRALGSNFLRPEFFTGKAVFVGESGIITANGPSLDRYATPFSRWGHGQMSGVELQATAFLNLVRGDWLEELSPAMKILLVLLAGMLF